MTPVFAEHLFPLSPPVRWSEIEMAEFATAFWEPNLHFTFLVMPRDKYAQIFARTLITDSRGGVFQISRGVTRGPLIFHVWKTGNCYVRLCGYAIYLVIPITLISRLIEREDRVDFLR